MNIISNQADQNDEETTTSPFKAMLVAVGILGLVFSIFTLLPMFFTLLSDGDFRAPAEIHPTDTAARANSQNHSTKAYLTDKSEPLTKKVMAVVKGKPTYKNHLKSSQIHFL